MMTNRRTQFRISTGEIVIVDQTATRFRLQFASWFGVSARSRPRKNAMCLTSM